MRLPRRYASRNDNISVNRQRSTVNGFSLIEVMVASAILGLSLLIIYSLYIKTFQAANRSEIKAVAMALAQETMENLINRPFANIALWANTSPAPPDTATFDNITGGQTTETVVKTSAGTQSDYATYQQTISKIGINFTVTALISWRDDDNDGLAPSDPDPLDFKRVHISVTWPGNNVPVVLDRFVSLYYRPYASSSSGVETGEFLLSDGSGQFARLGSASLETYTGGNKTAKVEAQGLSAVNFTSGQIATITKLADDDMGTSTPQESHGESKVDDIDVDDDDDLGISPVFYKDDAESTAQVSSAATKNIVSSKTWHAGEFASSDGWPDISSEWPSPPNWSTAWILPSAIAKANLTIGMIFNYNPNQSGIKLFETGEARAGSKSVIASGSSNDKIVTRSWSLLNDVKIIETSLVPNGIIWIDKVEALVQTQANGSSPGSITSTSFVITNLRVYKDGAYVTAATVDEQADITGIGALPTPITSITYNKTSTTSTNKAQAETSLVIETAVNGPSGPDSLISGVTIPPSKITLGAAQANVSYTTK